MNSIITIDLPLALHKVLAEMEQLVLLPPKGALLKLSFRRAQNGPAIDAP